VRQKRAAWIRFITSWAAIAVMLTLVGCSSTNSTSETGDTDLSEGADVDTTGDDVPDFYSFINCGNGECASGESSASCPADCGTECGDGVCNGDETVADCANDCSSVCGNGQCDGGETGATCPADCKAECGDGVCVAGEMDGQCPQDCGDECGDGICSSAENTITCMNDCGTLCGDGICNGDESTVLCTNDCGASCGDGQCNGPETSTNCVADCGSTCGDGVCNGDESSLNCVLDCGTVCGDGACNGDETTTNCTDDCGALCGDGQCNGGETTGTCAQDCGALCGDGVCNSDETSDNCTPDCGALCGDGTCNGDETTVSCTADCGVLCGDGICNGDEDSGTCAADCGSVCGDGTCNGNETTVNCTSDCGSDCGDGACNGNETTVTCGQDCGSDCGDGACNGNETTVNCPADCGSDCGDGTCNGNETTVTCGQDCGSDCGDGTCNGNETTVNCPADCGSDCGDGSCAPGVEDCGKCPGDCPCPAGKSCENSQCVADEPPNPSTQPALPSNFSGVVWLHVNVSKWAQTATLSSVTFKGANICLDYDKTNVWPGVEISPTVIVNGNPWIFVYQNGTWYAATWEWLRVKQTCKASKSVAGDHIKKNPLKDFKPVPGATYYFMVSGLARDPNITNVQERSNPVKVVWPGGSNPPPTDKCNDPASIFKPQREAWRAEGKVSVSGNRFKVGGQVYYPNTDFLTAVSPGDNWKKWSSLFYLARTKSQRKTIREALVAAQYNSIYLFTLNQDVISFSPYGSGSFSVDTSQLNQSRVNEWKSAIEELIANQLKPFIWLAGDDSPKVAKMSLSAWKNYVVDMVAAFESYPIVWVIGLEVDEYWSTGQVEERRAYLMKKTQHPVGVHLTTIESKNKKTPYQNGFDFVMGQFASPQSNAKYVEQVKAYLISGIPYIASEFNVTGKGSGSEAKSTVTERSRDIGEAIAGIGSPPLVAGLGNGINLCNSSTVPNPGGPSCGDKQCNADTENCSSCPGDCPCPTGKECKSGQCVDEPQGPSCGDKKCAPGVENCKNCPGDCPCPTGTSCNSTGQCADPSLQPGCGDKVCAPGKEDCGSCPGDCPCPTGKTCSNGQCV
jgi:hypothetical protein